MASCSTESEGGLTPLDARSPPGARPSPSWRTADARSGCRRALRSFVAPRGSRRRRACLFYLRFFLAKVNLSYAYANGWPGVALAASPRRGQKRSRGQQTGRSCVVRSRLAGFGRHLDVEPAHSAGVQAEGRTAVAASCGVDAATSSHNCKTRGLALSGVAAAIDSSLFASVAVAL